MPVFEEIEKHIKFCEKDFDTIPLERKHLLNSFAEYISLKLNNENAVNLTFICTHNSRRSHISQIWARASAEFYGIKNVNCFSGGTEATAFNPRAVNALRKAGFEIIKNDDSENPVFLVKYAEDADPLKCFSKVYNDPFNPQNNYAAVMTCSDADENCPVVFGADARFPIRYEDPKKYDGTESEEKMYEERCRQIASEMIYVFNKVKKP